MRRIKITYEPATYHVISRIVAGERLLKDRDREVLRRQMWRMAAFCGVEIRTYCILSNHFHFLVRVPPKQELPDEELVRRYAALYGENEAKILKANLQSAALREPIRRGLLKRMNDISFFMKELKLRFTRYYNRRHERFGTLWAEKFKSLLVENDEYALKMVAAYIDLNPVRAGLCKDPKDYRFCGYAEAVAGTDLARHGLQRILTSASWTECSRQYRMILFGTGTVTEPHKGGIDPDKCRQVLESGGKLSLWELVRCRVCYFSDGLALGSPEFIEQLRKRHPGFPSGKRAGASPEAPVSGGTLCFARRKRTMPRTRPRQK